MKKALVIGAGGFIGHNMVKRLKSEGWYVVGLDLKKPLFEESPADEFIVGDVRNMILGKDFDRIYQFAAQMGGAGFIFSGENDADILTDSFEINSSVLKQLKDYKGTIFYSSSVCCYPDGVEGKESDAYPAHPPFLYGWEKLTSEQLYQAYNKKYGLKIKIARFHNTFGPNGTYDGGREKFPAAICRKVSQALPGGEIEVWGNGEQRRPFIYIDDLLDGIEALFQSNIEGPVNLGPDDAVVLKNIIDLVIKISGKNLKVKYISGATGELSRHPNCQLARETLRWAPKISIEDAFSSMYKWVNSQVWKSLK